MKKKRFVFHIMKVRRVIWITFKLLFLSFSGAFISFLFNKKEKVKIEVNDFYFFGWTFKASVDCI